jgi:hypothetical protein
MSAFSCGSHARVTRTRDAVVVTRPLTIALLLGALALVLVGVVLGVRGLIEREDTATVAPIELSQAAVRQAEAAEQRRVEAARKAEERRRAEQRAAERRRVERRRAERRRAEQRRAAR